MIRWRTGIALLLVATMVPLGAGAWSLDPGPVGQTDRSGECGHEGAGLARTTGVSVDEQAALELAAVIDPALGVDEGVLDRLFAAYEALPGFVDIQFVLQGTPRFAAFFVLPPPAVLPETQAPYPVFPMRIDPTPLSGGPGMKAETLGEEPGLAQGVVSAESHGDVSSAPPLIPSACSGLYPGAGLQASCTMAWLLSGSDGKEYVATAGHCVGAVGSYDGYGVVRYRIANGVGADFAVIEIDPSWLPQADPAMCHWGGPTAGAHGTARGTDVYQYGRGTGFGQTVYTRPRTAELWGVGPASYSMVGPQINGDSGSPTRTAAGPALGVHTHGTGLIVIGTGMGFGIRLSHGLELAEDALGISFTLRTAPVA